MDLVLVIYIGATFEQEFDDVEITTFGRNGQGSIAGLSKRARGRPGVRVGGLGQ